MRFLCLMLAAILAIGTTLGCKKAQEAISSVGKAAKDVASSAGESISNKAKDVAENVTQATTDVAKQATDAVDNDGSVIFNVGDEVNLTSCFATFTPSVAGRQSLLQLRTYDRTSANQYPAAFLHAPVDAATVDELLGKTVEARVFLQDESGTLWDNVDSELVSLAIESLEDSRLTIRVTNGQLMNTKTGAAAPLSGSAVAVLSK